MTVFAYIAVLIAFLPGTLIAWVRYHGTKNIQQVSKKAAAKAHQKEDLFEHAAIATHLERRWTFRFILKMYVAVNLLMFACWVIVSIFDL